MAHYWCFFPEKAMSTYTFKTNINCLGCVTQIKPKLDQLEQNKTIDRWHVNFNHPEHLLEIETEKLAAEDVKRMVQEWGFKAEPLHASQPR